MVLFPFFVGNTGHGKEGIPGFDVGAEAIHAPDGVEIFGADVGAFGIDELVLHVNRNDFAEDNAGTADFHGGDFAAFEAGGSFEDSRRRNLGGRSGVQLGHFQFVHACGEIDGANIHGFSDIFTDDVDDEFAGVADVARGVLADDARARAIADTDGDDGRISADVVVGAERGSVDLAFEIDGGDQCDGAGCDEADEEIVG